MADSIVTASVRSNGNPPCRAIPRRLISSARLPTWKLVRRGATLSPSHKGFESRAPNAVRGDQRNTPEATD